MSNESKKRLDALWQKALRKGECPFEGCKLTLKTCTHLDKYLDYSSSTFTNPKNGHFYDASIKEKPIKVQKVLQDGPKRTTVWVMFKSIRHYNLLSEEIGIILRKFALNMSEYQIQIDMGWTSRALVRRFLQSGLKKLKVGGFNGI